MFPAGRHLLFGMIALQLNIITREQLLSGFDKWVRSKEFSLSHILVDQNAITFDEKDLLERMVETFIRRHGGKVEQSLACLSLGTDVNAALKSICDADLDASLRQIRRGPLPDEYATVVPSETKSVGRFQILRPHARGGLGKVSVARDEDLDRQVALKEILPDQLDDVSRERFVLEAKVTGGLEHPGIVPVYALGQTTDGRPFYAMRFVQGDSLKAEIEKFYSVNHTDRSDARKSQLSFREHLGRFVDVCNAIEYAHSRGVLHRDLKPGNIMVGKYGETLVVDWGLAKIAGAKDRFADEATLRPSSGLSSSAQTQPGSAMGTPAYMSPEQAGGKLDLMGPTADVYSLGATLYHLVTGKPPFEKMPLDELLPRIQKGAFRPPKDVNPSIPIALNAICLKAMAVNSQERYQSARQLADDIERWLADEPVSAYVESVTDKVFRWCRKNKSWSFAFATILLMISVLSATAAANANRLRLEKEKLVGNVRSFLQSCTELESLVRGVEATKPPAGVAEPIHSLPASEVLIQIQRVRRDMLISLAEIRALDPELANIAQATAANVVPAFIGD